MNPNEVRLIDFDMDTLADVNVILNVQISRLSDHTHHSCSEQRFNEIQRNIDRLRTFQTQLLYAFSLVKEREKVSQS